MNEITKALKALDRIFNYCEEIDLHIPKEEQVGYDMLVDINIIREALVNQKSFIEELEQLKADIKEASYDRLDGFNGGQMVVDWEDIEDMFYDHISEIKGENNEKVYYFKPN